MVGVEHPPRGLAVSGGKTAVLLLEEDGGWGKSCDEDLSPVLALIYARRSPMGSEQKRDASRTRRLIWERADAI